jgi:TRAP-type C4-dicarboxylate transport system permease small subunit
MQCYVARIASCLPQQSVLNFYAKAIIAVFATIILCWAYGLFHSLWEGAFSDLQLSVSVLTAAVVLLTAGRCCAPV